MTCSGEQAVTSTSTTSDQGEGDGMEGEGEEPIYLAYCTLEEIYAY
jgi:hypothetical protein